MRQRRPWPLILPLALLSLAGCSGTPFGDQLSRSFSQPQAAPVTPAKPASPATAPKPVAKPVALPTPAPAPKRVAPAAPLTPAPYRVTIKLPAADPSSPAEAVTDALRSAGVAFEVETIERVPAGAEAAVAPVRSSAPPAR
ncbi:MAG: hypothetical protein FJ056_00305 [Cyanobacteria bacterium M_surface_10_m2_179]|nr:hypothetical protein [Cyanobacteria bacterium M_surface_10_m2_179]